ncbi:DALR anticodon-binding domain-containing protein [Chamaesiphon sp. VAR_69_metabat_338]|uniref:DALR anticodon-binding domain-containing protein n=1 Tax=Chamaesiphon sp. VAR_69_metabat_338 TaxID=2964704 RepID=UPI00286E1030|nr:DALR anticodon-binding domain-containing protein [Chamaesiphon sp. VAR_69_metabat_338]
MKIFRWSDPILLPLAPTIAGTIAAYLRLISERVYSHLSCNYDNLAPELPTDESWFWQCQQSIKSVTTTQYQYVSTFAHRLAAKSALTPLEICQICQICQPPILPDAVDLATGLELSCWYNEAGYLYFQLTPASIERWLDYLDRLPPLDLAVVPTHWHTTGTSGSALAIYAHARCCSLLKLADREQSISLTTDWRIEHPDRLLNCREDRQLAGSIGIFDRPVERQLIQTLMAIMDAIYIHQPPSLLASTVSMGSHRSPRSTPNWSKLTIDLAQSWLDFYRDCRIFGEIKQQNPHLAIARCGLTAIVRRYLQILLESLGAGVVEEL